MKGEAGKSGGAGGGAGGPEFPAQLATMITELERVKNSPEGRARLAVLHAVKQAIAERGGAMNCASLAAALLSSLAELQDEETSSAVLFLLTHILQHVGPNLLRNKLESLVDVVGKAISNFSSSASVARHGDHCMFIIAKSQEPTAWRGPEISIIVDLLLSHSVDTRPKVRKSAQGFIVSLISEEGQAVEVARSFIESKVMGFSSSVFKSCTGTETVTALQLLGMIRDVSPFFSANAIQSIAQNLVKMLSSDNGKMSQHVYSCLDSMMQVGEEDGETVWSEKLLSRIIAAGVSSRPNVLSGSESIVACFRFLLTAVAKLQERSSMAAAEAASLVFGSGTSSLLTASR